MSRPNIFTKLKRDIYGKHGIEGLEYLHRRKNDQEWIKERQTDLNETYDITSLHGEFK